MSIAFFVPDREEAFLTDSHIKLDILVNTQEPFKNSHHNIAFDYDEDIMSLMVEQPLFTLDILLSNNSNPYDENASIAFEYELCEIEDDTPQFNCHRPKTRIPKNEFPKTICTADTMVP